MIPALRSLLSFTLPCSASYPAFQDHTRPSAKISSPQPFLFFIIIIFPCIKPIQTKSQAAMSQISPGWVAQMVNDITRQESGGGPCFPQGLPPPPSCNKPLSHSEYKFLRWKGTLWAPASLCLVERKSGF